MNNSGNLFDMLFRIFLKNAFNPDSTGNPKDNRAENMMMLAALGLLAFVGADAMKVIFRKNFGSNGLSLIRVVLSFVAFMLIAVTGYYLSKPDAEIDPAYGTHQTYLLASIFYVLLGFYVFIKGLKHKKESSLLDLNPEYKGDSYLLSFLVNSGWSQANVQNWAEPLFTLCLGGLLAVVNLLWGLPLVFCSLSVWGYQIVEYLFGQNPVADKIQGQGYQSQNDDYTQVHH